MMTSTENKVPKVFLDTNVIIDGLTERDNAYKPSKELLRLIVAGKYKGYICSKQITDIHYIFRKYVNSKADIMRYIKNITLFFEIMPLLKGDILACLKSKAPDFEDAILCEVAKTNMIPILVTNDVKGFDGYTPLLVVTPQQFLEMFSLEQ